MRQTLKDLQRRILKLEQHAWPEIPPGIRYLEHLDADETAAMTADEVIVEDTYENAAGRIVRACERITSDPFDIGKHFAYDSWDCAAFEMSDRPLDDIRIVWTRASKRWRPREPNSILQPVLETSADVDEPGTSGKD